MKIISAVGFVGRIFLIFSSLTILKSFCWDGSVRVTLQSAFLRAPLLLEMMETLADQRPESFEGILDEIARGRFKDLSTMTEQEVYENFIKIGNERGYLTDATTIDLFDYGLSIHASAARIQAQFQFYETVVRPRYGEGLQDKSACSTWVAMGNDAICGRDIDERLKARLKHEEREDSLYKLGFDRIIGDEVNPIRFILYADLTAQGEFRDVYTKVRMVSEAEGLSFVVRYVPSYDSNSKPLLLQGYGAYLAVKKADYLVIDDDDEIKVDGKGSAMEGKKIFKVAELKDEQLEQFGYKLTSYVLNERKEKGKRSAFQRFVHVMENLPVYRKIIAEQPIRPGLRENVMGNFMGKIRSGANILWLNGLGMDLRQVSAFSILEKLRREYDLVSYFDKLGINGDEYFKLVTEGNITQGLSDESAQRYDFNDEYEGGEVIVWLNNIEKDSRYKQWPRGLEGLYRMMFPGQVPRIRRDIFNAIFVIDMGKQRDLSKITKEVRDMIKQRIPIRFGIVGINKSEVGMRRAKLVYSLLKTHGLLAVMEFLTGCEELNSGEVEKGIFDEVRAKFKRIDGVDKGRETYGEIIEGQGEKMKAQIAKVNGYLERMGMTGEDEDGGVGWMIVNGVVIMLDEDWIQKLSTRISLDLAEVQRLYGEGKIEESMWIPRVFLTEGLKRRNRLISWEWEGEDGEGEVNGGRGGEVEGMVNLVKFYEVDMKAEGRHKVPRITFMKIGEKVNEASVELVIGGDFSREDGERLVGWGYEWFKERGGNGDIVMIHTGNWGKSGKLGKLIARTDGLKNEERLKEMEEYFGGKEKKNWSENEDDVTREFWKERERLGSGMGMKKGGLYIVFNGRKVGPIEGGQKKFDKVDFWDLEKMELKRGQSVMKGLKNVGIGMEGEKERNVNWFASIVSILSIVSLSERQSGEGDFGTRSNEFMAWNGSDSSILVSETKQNEAPKTNFPNGKNTKICMHVMLDPTTEVAQRWAGIFRVLGGIRGVWIRIYFYPRIMEDKSRFGERFYRFGLQGKLEFGGGAAAPGTATSSAIQFSGLPSNSLLTMGLDVTGSWMISAKYSKHDLDNLQILDEAEENLIEAVYQLEHILVEGHAKDLSTGHIPRGAELVLKEVANDGTIEYKTDTIIMANLGYFQFKAKPGYFLMKLKPGRSEDIYCITKVGRQSSGFAIKSNTTLHNEDWQIIVMKFDGLTLNTKMRRKHGMLHENVLEAATSSSTRNESKSYLSEQMGKLGQFLHNMVSTTPVDSTNRTQDVEEDNVINIFTVASGHLYERMLKVMMLSVIKQTAGQHKIRFWFLGQFLSAKFKQFLPIMSQHYSFDYQIVQYKWPYWLREQSEKQREIWGYKILFLDVLFPLRVKRIIFIDADGFVKGDIWELVKLKLHDNSPYAFAPMCDDELSMEGFRFWKSGYWKSHLQGLPYHISALFLVDLTRFRKMAAGDILRQQYQQLSRDPESLANLDQDLPNNLQRIISIHSLKQDWLWCETWCSQDRFASAKVIDLCNNPKTKEAKLSRARRQIRQWTVYDDEIKSLEQTGGNKQAQSSPGSTQTAQSSEYTRIKQEL